MKTYNQFINEAYTVLDISNKNLKKLLVYSALTELNCSRNKLSSLPELPKTLRYLDCNINQLKSLPTLPSKLIILDCGNNFLTSLPELPEGLETLSCHNNKLKTFPKIPDSLRELFCYHNPLECLIPEKFVLEQSDLWLYNTYYPFIKSYEGQKKILTNNPDQVKELISQVDIHPDILKEFPHLFAGGELNLL